MVDFMENPGGPAIPILSYGNIEGQWPLLCLDREEGGRRELKANYKRLCPSSSSSSRGRLPTSLPPTGNGANANWDKNDGDCSFCVATRSFLAPLSPLFTYVYVFLTAGQCGQAAERDHLPPGRTEVELI